MTIKLWRSGRSRKIHMPEDLHRISAARYRLRKKSLKWTRGSWKGSWRREWIRLWHSKEEACNHHQENHLHSIHLHSQSKICCVTRRPSLERMSLHRIMWRRNRKAGNCMDSLLILTLIIRRLAIGYLSMIDLKTTIHWVLAASR